MEDAWKRIESAEKMDFVEFGLLDMHCNLERRKRVLELGWKTWYLG